MRKLYSPVYQIRERTRLHRIVQDKMILDGGFIPVQRDLEHGIGRGGLRPEEPFRDDEKSLPVAGAPGDVGIVFNFYTRPEKDR